MQNGYIPCLTQEKGTCNSVVTVEKGHRSNGAKREEASDKVTKGAVSSGHKCIASHGQ